MSIQLLHLPLQHFDVVLLQQALRNNRGRSLFRHRNPNEIATLLKQHEMKHGSQLNSLFCKGAPLDCCDCSSWASSPLTFCTTHPQSPKDNIDNALQINSVFTLSLVISYLIFGVQLLQVVLFFVHLQRTRHDFRRELVCRARTQHDVTETTTNFVNCDFWQSYNSFSVTTTVPT